MSYQSNFTLSLFTSAFVLRFRPNFCHRFRQKNGEWVRQPAEEVQARLSGRTKRSVLFEFVWNWMKLICYVCSGKDFSDHTLHVRLFRQHLPGHDRHRLPLQDYVPRGQNGQHIFLILIFSNKSIAENSWENVWKNELKESIDFWKWRQTLKLLPWAWYISFWQLLYDETYS